MPTPTEVFNGLRAVVGKLKKSEGYSITVEDRNINTTDVPSGDGSTANVEDYPRAYLVALGADYETMPGKRVHVTVPYILMILLAFTPEEIDSDPEIKMKSALKVQEDVERLVSAHTQFAGVDTLEITSFASDVVTNQQEVALVFDLVVRYRRTV